MPGSIAFAAPQLRAGSCHRFPGLAKKKYIFASFGTLILVRFPNPTMWFEDKLRLAFS